MSKKSSVKNVIVIAPHPDDETLGLGGTLLKHKAQGDKVACVFVTNISEKQGYSKEKVESRQKEIDKVSSLYDFDKTYKLDYPTTSLDLNSLKSLVEDFSEIFEEFEPNIVYLPNKNDVHSDHRIIFDAAFSCTKSFRYPSVEKILMYETLSETEFAPAIAEDIFVPNYFENISEFFAKKIEIANVYTSEMAQHPFPRSEKNIKALATYRGASCSVEYAEAFQLLKWIN